MSTIHERINQISQKHGLSHLGSCHTAVDIIDAIYQIKKPDEPFVLSCGHAGLALYVVLEKHSGGTLDAEYLYLKHGTHPNRDMGDGIPVSTGSLGWGLAIALGMAMADRSKTVHCLISDGEAFEGTIWEVSNVMRRYKVTNLAVHMNYNGWAAYHAVDDRFISRVQMLMPGMLVHTTKLERYGLKGQEAHYCKVETTVGRLS